MLYERALRQRGGAQHEVVRRDRHRREQHTKRKR